jgi:hypothetical protein
MIGKRLGLSTLATAHPRSARFFWFSRRGLGFGGLAEIENHAERVDHVTARHGWIFLDDAAPGGNERAFGGLNVCDKKLENRAMRFAFLDVESKGSSVEPDQCFAAVRDGEIEDGAVKLDGFGEGIGSDNNVAGRSEFVFFRHAPNSEATRLDLKAFSGNPSGMKRREPVGCAMRGEKK